MAMVQLQVIINSVVAMVSYFNFLSILQRNNPALTMSFICISLDQKGNYRPTIRSCQS